MNLYSYYLCVLFLALCNSSIAQVYTIISSSDSAAIPYANITFHSKESFLGGTYSNSAGQFFVADSNVVKFSISHVTFRDTVIYLNEGKTPEKLYLMPDNLSLQTVVISGIQPENARTKYLGVQPQKRKLLFFRKNDGRNFGRFLINCDTSRQRPQKIVRLQPGEAHEKSIKSFVFYSDVRHKSTNYIVKVLFYENQDGFPKRKLPYEVVKELTPKDNGRVEVDVTGHGIVLPPEGLFIGLEFVGCSEYLEVPEPSKLKQNLKSYSFGAIRDYLVVVKDLDARSEKVYVINIDETGEEHRVQIPPGDGNNLQIPVFGLVVYE